MKQPCAKCPFRADVPFFLTEGRYRQMLHDIEGDTIFPCHESANANPRQPGKWYSCFGSALYLERSQPDRGGVRANSSYRIHILLNRLNLADLEACKVPTHTREEFDNLLNGL